MLRYSIRNLWEANPIQAGFQVDFEEREADPSKYTIGQKLHPAADMQQDMDGGNDGMPAPYDGAQMPGGMPPGMPGMGEPQGGPMPDEQLQNIQPGMQPPQTQPGMQESLMKKDDLDLFLDALLDESVDELTEGPFDYYPGPAAGPTAHQPSNYGPGYGGYRGGYGAAPQPNYGGYGAAPPASYYRTPPGNPDTSANALNRQELERITGDNPAYRPGGYPAYPAANYDEPRPGDGGMAGPRGGGGRGPAAGRTAPQGPNANIRSIQDRLNGMGAGLRPDGLMGPQTRAAIQNFQKGQGITSDGIWGKNTQGAYDRMNANNPALRGAQPLPQSMTGQNKPGMGTVPDREKDMTPATATQPGGNTSYAAQNVAGLYGAAQGAANRQTPQGSNPAAAVAGITSNRGRALLNPANTNTNAQAATGTQGGYGARGQALLRGNPGGPVDLGGNPQAAVTGGGQVGVGRNAQLRTGNAGGGVVAPGSPAAAGAVTNTNAPSFGSRALDFGGKALNWVGRKMPYVGAALDTAQELRANPNDPGRAAASGVGTGTGMWQGGIRGAALGARLTPGGPVTKGIGSLVGGTLGAIGGSEGGKALTTGAYDWATGGGQPQKQTPAATAQSQPPPANNAASAVQPETVRSQPTSESAMTWNDYMVLFESDKR